MAKRYIIHAIITWLFYRHDEDGCVEFAVMCATRHEAERIARMLEAGKGTAMTTRIIDTKHEAADLDAALLPDYEPGPDGPPDVCEVCGGQLS